MIKNEPRRPFLAKFAETESPAEQEESRYDEDQQIRVSSGEIRVPLVASEETRRRMVSAARIRENDGGDGSTDDIKEP